MLLLLSGCWDRIELENRESVIGLAVDIINEESEHNSGKFMYKVAAQIAIPGQIPMGEVRGDLSGGGGRVLDNVLVTEAIGNTIDHALQNMQDKLAHELFLGQLQVVIISETMAERGVTQLNEFFQRRPEVRRTLWALVCTKNATEVLNTPLPMERIPALHISSMFKTAERLGRFPKVKIGDFWNVQEKKGQEPILPLIKLVEDELVQMDGLAYFVDNQMVGTLTTDQITFYSILMGENPGGATTLITLSDAEENVMIESIFRTIKRNVKLINDAPYVDLQVSITTKIREKSKEAIDLSNPQTIDFIKNEAEKYFTDGIKNLIAQTQKDSVDIFGFGEYVRAKHPRYWDEHIKTKQGWREKYKDLTINVKTNVEIQRIGMKSK